MKEKEEDREIILSQWQTCVEMANSVSQRRDSMNNIFITLNLAVTTAVTLTAELKTILLLIAGVVLCCVWLCFIKNYKNLNAEKFQVIIELESLLPEKPFSNEWDKLKKIRKYKDSTTLEMILPIMFIILYMIAMFVILLAKR